LLYRPVLLLLLLLLLVLLLLLLLLFLLSPMIITFKDWQLQAVVVWLISIGLYVHRYTHESCCAQAPVMCFLQAIAKTISGRQWLCWRGNARTWTTSRQAISSAVRLC
jgi:hypothetical protein